MLRNLVDPNSIHWFAAEIRLSASTIPCSLLPAPLM